VTTKPFTRCVKCGAEKNDGPECLHCGVIYAKAEKAYTDRLRNEEEKARSEKEEAERAKREKEEEQGKQQTNQPVEIIAFNYQDASGVATSREVKNPVRYQHQGSWYINGFCLLRQEGRTFRADRIDGDITDTATGEIVSIDRLQETEAPSHWSQQEEQEDRDNLIPCPTCHRSISKNAAACPHCGEQIRKENPLSPPNTPRTKSKPMGCFGWVITVFAILWLVGQCNHNTKTDTPKTVPAPPSPRTLEPSTPANPPSQPSAPQRNTAGFADAFAAVLNSMYGNVCQAEISGFFSKTLKVDWTANTKMIHSIKVLGEVGSAKEQLYNDGVRYFQFPNDAGTYNVIDWKTGEKKSISDKATYYFREK